MEEFLSTMRAFEIHSIQETQNQKFLEGFKQLKAGTMAKEVEVHLGAIKLIKEAQKRNIAVSIISVSWSKHLIEESLSIHLPSIKDIQIFSNELEYNSNGISTGNIIGGIHSGLEKRDSFKRLLESVKKQHYDVNILFHSPFPGNRFHCLCRRFFF